MTRAGRSSSRTSPAMSRRSSGTRDPADAAPLFAALGDATPLALLDRLGAGGPQSITRHLHILADAGLVHDSRRGRERIWTLDTKRLDEARRSLDQIAQQWDAALGRLKMFVEDEQESAPNTDHDALQRERNQP